MATDDKFEISIDPGAGLMRITLRGYWTVETVDDYRNAVLRAANELYSAGCERGRLLALVDARAGGAQSQDVIDHYKRKMGDGALTPRRLATLLSSALLKRQVDRIDIANQGVFLDEKQALDWLLE